MSRAALLLVPLLLIGCGSGRDASRAAGDEAAMENQAAVLEASAEQSSNQTMHQMIDESANAEEPATANTAEPGNGQTR